jgi:succinate dehydrogenase / fumarate reductase, cytochrome b subunit
MKWSQFFNTSIGKKLLVGATGLFLCSFVIVHLAGNIALLKEDGGEAFNTYAAFMGHNPLIQFIAWGLKIIIIVHAFLAIQLTIRNRAARPVKYAVQPGNKTSSWYSRQMAVMGSILFIFLVIHLSQFWWGMHYGAINTVLYDGKETSNIYEVVWFAFKETWIVALYVIGMFALAFHLIHGFKSACQTFGLNHKKYNGIINFIGVWLFGVLIPLGFAVIPVVIYIKQI